MNKSPTRRLHDAVYACGTTFNEMEWRWVVPKDHIPCFAEIEKKFKEHLRVMAKDDELISRSCGRLMVTHNKEGRCYYLSLELCYIGEEELAEVLG